MKKQQFGLRKGDFVIIAVILLLAIALLFFLFLQDSSKKVAIITQNHVIIERIDLSQMTEEDGQKKIAISGDYQNEIVVERERVCIAQSDCSNQLCVKTGWISKNGQSIVCLPNKVLIKMVSEEDEGVDVVAN